MTRIPGVLSSQDILRNMLGGSVPGLAAGARRAPSVTLDPEEERSLVDIIQQGSLGGIATIGNVLDTDAAFIRSLLAGKNPFPGVLSPEERTTGRELLETWNLAPKNKPGFRPLANPVDALFDVAGFGAEVVLDPKTWLTLGGSAFGKLGQAMKGAGKLDDITRIASRKMRRQVGPRLAKMVVTGEDILQDAARRGAKEATEEALQMGLGSTKLADVASQPVGGLFGVRPLPFASPVRAVGTGKFSHAVADRMDKLAAAMGKSAPVRHWKAIMHAPTQQTITAEIQPGAAKLFEQKQMNRVAVRAEHYQDIQKLKKLGLAGDDDASTLRQLLEFPDPGHEAAEVISTWTRRMEKVYGDRLRSGVPTKYLDDPAGTAFGPRQLSEASKIGRPSGIFKAKTGMDFEREDWLKSWKGGTETIRKIVKDPAIIEAADAAEALAREGGNLNQARAGRVTAASRLIRKKYGHLMMGKKGRISRANSLGHWIANELTPDQRKLGGFGNHILADMEKYEVASRDAIAVAEFVTDNIAKYAMPLDKIKPGTKAVKVAEVLERAGMELGTRKGGGIRRVLEKMRLPVQKEYWKEVRELRVPEHIADDLARLYKSTTGQDAVANVMHVVDSATNIFKAGVLTWPARYVRDFVSGQYNNIATGNFNMRSHNTAQSILRGGVVKDAAKRFPIVAKVLKDRGLPATAENADEVLKEILYSHQVINRFEGIYGATDVAGAAGTPIRGSMSDLTSEIPGQNPFRFRDVFAKMVKGKGLPDGGTYNPFEIRGVSNLKGEVRTETLNRIVAGGQDLGHYTDGMNRLVPFLYNLEKGVDPRQAKLITDALQVSYAPQNFTAFEREKLKRLFPFYAFSSRMIPATLRQLIENPGGGIAQTIRGTDRLRGERGDILPEYVAETAAIPLGEDEEGNKSFLTGAGFMHEEPLGFVGAGPQGAGLELLSKLNPLIKGPLEAITGQSFFQKGPSGGRPLEELDPSLGRMISNVKEMATGVKQEKPVNILGNERASRALEATLANSPLSRLITSMRTLSDPRKTLASKALNLGTGFRVATVSPAAQDAMLREMLSDMMLGSGAKKFEKVYFSKDDLAKMSPEQLEAALKFTALQTLLASRAKKRKQGTLMSNSP